MTDTIIAKRKAKKITQAQLAEMTGINRGMISRLESCDYTPSVDQLQAIAEALDFEVVDLFEDEKADKKKFLIAIFLILLIKPFRIVCESSDSLHSFQYIVPLFLSP